jgi:deazaflavin-dependent oxidoreductase (nitroreductase family)
VTGLAELLGLPDRDDGPVRKALREILALPVMTPLVRPLAVRVDSTVLRVTSGRTTATSALTGLPVVWITTASEAGRPHTVPLVPIPHGENVAVIGSALGSETVPRWARNLEARAEATVRLRDREARVRARSAEDAEEQQIWQVAIASYRGFERYRARAAGRRIPVFVLEPA